VSALGDVLELLYNARKRYRSVRLEAREYSNYRVQQDAFERMRRAESGTGTVSMQVYATTTDEEPPEEGEASLRLWFEQPNRFREERLESGRRLVMLGDGERWWTSSPDWGTVVQEGDGWEQAFGGTRTLLDPAPVIAAVELDVRGRAQLAGRDAVIVHGVQRSPHRHEASLPWGATDHELLVDAERGVLLRLASSLDGAVFSALDVTSIAFDETLDESVFRYEAVEGEEVLRPEDVSPGEAVPIEEAARRASFTVVVPAALGRGWHTHALYVAGRGRIPETVHISLFRQEGTNTVAIRETAPPFERWQLSHTEQVERDGSTLHVSVDGSSRVLLERHGTCVELTSTTYTSDELVELALTLTPAAEERPPLLG
jgi:outer membrane lipoprotein-sorting protein